jgi:hypothetical protein
MLPEIQIFSDDSSPAALFFGHTSNQLCITI